MVKNYKFFYYFIFFIRMFFSFINCMDCIDYGCCRNSSLNNSPLRFPFVSPFVSPKVSPKDSPKISLKDSPKNSPFKFFLDPAYNNHNINSLIEVNSENNNDKIIPENEDDKNINYFPKKPEGKIIYKNELMKFILKIENNQKIFISNLYNFLKRHEDFEVEKEYSKKADAFKYIKNNFITTYSSEYKLQKEIDNYYGIKNLIENIIKKSEKKKKIDSYNNIKTEHELKIKLINEFAEFESNLIYFLNSDKNNWGLLKKEIVKDPSSENILHILNNLDLYCFY